MANHEPRIEAGKRSNRLQVLHLLLIILLFALGMALFQIRQQALATKTFSGQQLLQQQVAHWIDPSFFPAAKNDTTGRRKEASLNQQEQVRKNIAYAISITQCPDPTAHLKHRIGLIDAPAVLAHSIHLRHWESKFKYNYSLYAFVHPDARNCTSHLSEFNYTVLVQDTPINVSDIKEKLYRDRVQEKSAGCCQEKEFLKLYSLTLDRHPIVVHLDADTLLLKPLDELYDAMLLPDDAEKNLGKHAMWPKDQNISRKIETYFTRDYPMGLIDWPIEHYGMQGGFWIVRPNRAAFREMKEIILQGHFKRGWYDLSTVPITKYPGFYGAAMIQGLLAFYYGHVSPGQSVELNHCFHNNMADNPWKKGQDDKNVCSVPGTDCQDCRRVDISEVYSFHTTFCPKPWLCNVYSNSIHSQCKRFYHLWFQTRHHLETVAWGLKDPMLDPTLVAKELDYYGYCRVPGAQFRTTTYQHIPFDQILDLRNKSLERK